MVCQLQIQTLEDLLKEIWRKTAYLRYLLHMKKYQKERAGVQKKIHILCGSAMHIGLSTSFDKSTWH
jgi:hypothetical protein